MGPSFRLFVLVPVVGMLRQGVPAEPNPTAPQGRALRLFCLCTPSFSAEDWPSCALAPQVYKGRLKTGETVAVKVQRPYVLETVSIDLFIIRCNLVAWDEAKRTGEEWRQRRSRGQHVKKPPSVPAQRGAWEEHSIPIQTCRAPNPHLFLAFELMCYRSIGLAVRKYAPALTKRADIVALLDEWASRCVRSVSACLTDSRRSCPPGSAQPWRLQITTLLYFFMP